MFACSTTKKQANHSTFNFKSIDKNTHCGIQTSTQTIYSNKVDFERDWNLVWPNFEEPIALPKIDFTKETVVLVALGMRNNGGFQLKINSVSEETSQIIVEYTEITPNPKCSYSQAIVFPYEFISFVKTSKKVVFKSSTKVGECK